jgi:hypothetical protein
MLNMIKLNYVFYIIVYWLATVIDITTRVGFDFSSYWSAKSRVSYCGYLLFFIKILIIIIKVTFLGTWMFQKN